MNVGAILWFLWLGPALLPLLQQTPLSIREIIDEPKSFHLKQVTLRGTVHNVIAA